MLISDSSSALSLIFSFVSDIMGLPFPGTSLTFGSFFIGIFIFSAVVVLVSHFF